LQRICLILAILAGIGIIAVTEFKVRPHIQGIIDERETNKKNWKTQETRANKLDKDLATTRNTLEETKTKLTEAEGQREAARAQFAAEQKRANGLSQQLDKKSQDLKTALQDLAAWTGTGLTPDKVAALKTDNEKLLKAQEALDAENKIVVAELKKTKDLLYSVTNPNSDGPVLPVGTKGKVLVVDPKWDFVVVNLGEKDLMVPEGVLMVQRNGKLIGKVRITEVRSDRSIANVIPGWKLDEPMEGDMVFY
jgi:hypothetical protein